MNRDNINDVKNKNVVWHSYCIQKKNREALHKHHAMLLWFTGLSGSGKSAIANVLEQELHSKGVSTYVLDGDNIRSGLCRDLGFDHCDRYENIRRAGEIARLMIDSGLVVLASFISPYYAERKMVRDMFSKSCFIEIFVDTPLCVCEHRDTKGLYKKARSGEIKYFTGVSDPYDRPKDPDIYLNGQKPILELINQLLLFIMPKLLIKK